MVTFMEVSAGLNSLKLAKDFLQAMHGVYTAVQIQDVKFTLQGHILDAQQSLFDAQQMQTATVARVAELEQEVARLKNWESEKQQYELADAGQGALAYRKKAGVAGGEPPHWLCPNCYQRREKSILQPETRFPGRNDYLSCPSCKAELIIRGHRDEPNTGRRR